MATRFTLLPLVYSSWQGVHLRGIESIFYLVVFTYGDLIDVYSFQNDQTNELTNAQHMNSFIFRDTPKGRTRFHQKVSKHERNTNYTPILKSAAHWDIKYRKLNFRNWHNDVSFNQLKYLSI